MDRLSLHEGDDLEFDDEGEEAVEIRQSLRLVASRAFSYRSQYQSAHHDG